MLTSSAESPRTTLDEAADIRAALHAFDEALRRGMKSKAIVERAAAELKRHGALLDMAYPAWRSGIEDLEASTKTLSKDVAALEKQIADGLAQLEPLFLEGQALAAQGKYPYVEHQDTHELERSTNDWLARLPKDDWSNAIDPDEDKAIRWTTEGWVETG